MSLLFLVSVLLKRCHLIDSFLWFPVTKSNNELRFNNTKQHLTFIVFVLSSEISQLFPCLKCNMMTFSNINEVTLVLHGDEH